MGKYPSLDSALPLPSTTRNRAGQLLGPAMVLATLCILALASIAGACIAGVVFGSGGQGAGDIGIGVLGGASIISMLYTILHGVAARKNDAVGLVRPPVIKIHGMCFIVAKVALVIWIAALICECVLLRHSGPSLGFKVGCIIACASGVISTGVMLTALETSRYPFQLIPQRTIICRVSDFGDDVDTLERSNSESSFSDSSSGELKKAAQEIKRKPIPITTKLPEMPAEAHQHVPGEWPERPVTPLLPPKRMRSTRGWCNEWAQGGAAKALAREDSGISMYMSDASGTSRSSSGYMRSSASYGRNSAWTCSSDGDCSRKSRGSRQSLRVRTYNLGSGAVNYSCRSPLSSEMRTLELPELLESPTLRYTPPLIPVGHPHEWRLSRTASMSQLVPFVDNPEVQRRPSSAKLRGPDKDLAPIPGSPPLRRNSLQRRQSLRRETLARRMPGAYIEFYYEQDLDGHLRRIEESIARRPSQIQRRASQGPIRTASLGRARPKTPPLGMYAPRPVHPGPQLPKPVFPRTPSTDISYPGCHNMKCHANVRYSLSAVQERSKIRRAYTASTAVRPDLSRFEDALEEEEGDEVLLVKVEPLRRLSLGDIPRESLDLGAWGI